MSYIINSDEVEAVKKIMLSGCLDRYILGNNSISSKFERAFSEKFQTSYTLAVSSGTAALICSLVGMKIGPNDEVIIPAYTYVATALAVLAVGAKPVVADVDESLTIDPIDIKDKIKSKTKAIIPVHMRGLPCDMSAIAKIAADHNLLILEDVAQACGGSYQGQRLGTMGDAGMFSFNHYKILTCGEGGALITKHNELYQRAVLYHHGGCIYEPDQNNTLQINKFPGVNYRISEISSAMLLVQLKRLDLILEALRDEKRIILDKLSVVKSIMQPSLINDVEGDCGIAVFYLMRTVEDAIKFIALANEYNIGAYTGNTPGHTYHDWIPVLNCNEYSIEHCQRSRSILNRVVGIPTKVNRKYDELSNMLKKLISIARGL